MKLFFNRKRNFRTLWWLIVFFGILAFFTIPLILLSVQYTFEITLIHQAVIIIVTNVLCQVLSKRSIPDLIGKPGTYFLETFLTGALVGVALMMVPAIVMYIGGWVRWNAIPLDSVYTLLMGIVIILAGSIAEEFLFRGFLFQRLIDGLGIWLAQLIIAGLFLLTHMDNPGMTGITQTLASINIFIASLLFGFVFLRAKNLAMPIGLHFMANFTQGTILGFNVSGENEVGLFKPFFDQSPVWITGGDFGLEGSIFSLVILIGITVIFARPYSPGNSFT
jgi:uncharacterized protein